MNKNKYALIIIFLTIVALCSCTVVDYNRIELRYACRSDIDCTHAEFSCVSASPGDTLGEYCEENDCPNTEGFDLFKSLYKMPMICDYDKNNDGVADTPIFLKGSGEKIEISELFDNVECGVVLKHVAELEMCLPHLISKSFCNDTSECQSNEFCARGSAECTRRFDANVTCSRNEQCLSNTCSATNGTNGLCYDGKLGSICGGEITCDQGLICTGQQTTAPGFISTNGAEFCGDAQSLYSSCDPAKYPCAQGECTEINTNSDCYYSYRINDCEDYDSCSKICGVKNTSVFMCLQDE